MDKKEFRLAIKDIAGLLGFGDVDSLVEQLLPIVDVNEDGVLSFEEFEECFQGLAPAPGSPLSVLIGSLNDPTNEKLIAEVFHKYDTNGDGHLDGSEFKAVIADIAQLAGLEGDLEQLASELTVICDVNLDGKLQLSEFIECLQGLAK
uniref:EF-hand domain-containing protein n=1 Tax=Arcella intermedia TaxID=1963864 RepID=A0A6B2LMC6_9EUKA